MIWKTERPAKAQSVPIPLALENDRIVFQSREAVLGWPDGDAQAPKGEAKPLCFPAALLEARASTSIVYALNLPSPFGTGARVHGSQKVLSDGQALPQQLPSRLEAEFLRLSLPGGQIGLPETGGRSLLRFRWACLTAEECIGALWRCYTQMRREGVSAPWRAVASDYFFCERESLCLAPARLRIETGDDAGGDMLSLIHPPGKLTQFPCASGLTKLSCLSSDGWAKRRLESLHLLPDSGVIACFSDGKRRRFATACPANTRVARAA